MLVRVLIYGLCDSGRGFWKRLDGEAKTTGFVASQVFPAFYFYNISEEEDPETGVLMKTVAVMATHVTCGRFALFVSARRKAVDGPTFGEV